MAASIHVIESVGKFLGVGHSSKENLQKWKTKAEEKMKAKDFGLSLGSSAVYVSSRQKILEDAEKMITRIDLFQKLEEKKEAQDGVFAESKMKIEPTPGHAASSDQSVVPVDVDHVEHENKIGSKSSTRWTENEMYSTDESDTDFDAAFNTKTFNSAYTFINVDTNVKSTCKPNSYVNNSHDMYKVGQRTDSNQPTAQAAAKSGYEPNIVFFDELSASTKNISFENETLQTKFTTGKLKDQSLKESNKSTINKPIETSVEKPEPVVSQAKTDTCHEEQENITGKLKDLDSHDADLPVSIVDMEADFCTVNQPSIGVRNREQKQSKLAHEVLEPGDLVYEKEALLHYRLFAQIEAKEERNLLQTELDNKLAEYDWKLKAIDDIIATAKDFYMNPGTQKASKWKELKKRVKNKSSHHITGTEVRRKLGTLPDFRPYFTYCIILVQLVTFTLICAYSGLTYIGLEPKLSMETDIQTFLGLETVHKWILPNIWIGPSQKKLIGFGAVYSACMREDLQVQLFYANKNYSLEAELGCCKVATRDVAATTTQSECQDLTMGVGQWHAGVMCSERTAVEAGVRHVLRPCCVGLQGRCELLSYKHCLFLGGIFHQQGPDHCMQVNCLSETCQFMGMQGSKEQPWLPEAPNQWWRLLLSLCLHQGIIHVLVVAVSQWFMIGQIERTAGWLRVAIIYILAGTGALLASATFTPFVCSVGGVGAICGMLAVVLVELLQFWSIVKKPLRELAKLSAAILFLLFFGTFQYLDVIGMISGFVIGALSGVIVLPYITFRKWQTHARVVLVIVSFVLLCAMFFLLGYMFVRVQSFENCAGCKFINCIPYTETMCDPERWQQ
ncbi:inactive rhomboid protein 2-like isoform X1 [Dreissena polymorpha]|uniref:inactive rhomboid protein 2-like isoform X1 n=1 Tax=Dreissena polymorpha TaxID=45954 RepID=UPI00226529FE|nr:inactive rhomboid protein 2-like isoform X1 [Dreissena polymorpha]XP_052225870.1 inactive rhomboid protein 2-like isoform X1 [Dreissena polymorpha]